MVGNMKILDQQWKETQDHSKWGIEINGKFTCFSDINYMRSQEERGGGALCITDKSIGTAFKNTIIDLNPKMTCDKIIEHVQNNLVIYSVVGSGQLWQHS